MNVSNWSIRKLVAKKQLTFKAIAAEMGVRNESLSRIMRLPLTKKMEQRIRIAVDKLSANRETEDDDEGIEEGQGDQGTHVLHHGA